MRRLFHLIHEWATRNPVCRFDDPILGELVINESSWQCRVQSKSGPIILSVGGRYHPDETLLATARATFQQIDVFLDRVAAYLQIESQQETWLSFADDITALTVADINYWWPRHPTTGMIFFRGPDECKLWHCDIDGSKIDGLAFDS